MKRTICRCIVMFIYSAGEKNTVKESIQALLDASRHNDVEKNTKITEFVFNHMSFSHHQTERLRRMLKK